MKTIEQIYQIKATPEKIWNALVDPKVIEEWGGGPAVMDDKVGTEFSLWGKEVWGKNTEVIPLQKLAQEWFGGTWTEPSILTFTLTPTSDGTTFTLVQTNIPDDEVEGIEEGWHDYYLGPLQELVEKE